MLLEVDIERLFASFTMAHISFTHYLQLIDKAWQTFDGLIVSNLLSLRHDHCLSQNLHVENPDSMVERFVETPLDEIVICHIKCLWSLVTQNFCDAFQHQSNLIQCLIKIIQSQKEENWCLPVMYTVCLDIRLIAQRVEKEKIGKTDNPGAVLEKAAESLMGFFRVCCADNRSNEEDTKRLGLLTLVNQLFKVYFQIKKLHLCKPLIRAIESLPFKDSFSVSQQVTYKYFVGRKAMYDSDYKLADKYLSFAFENCHINSMKNKRLILIYLVPVKMLLGFMPCRYVLEKYDLLQFWELALAIKQGNIKALELVIEKFERFFVKCGIYLIVNNLKIVVYRNLFRKTYLVLNTHQIPIEALQAAIYVMGEDIDLEETQCIVANLIGESKIKGYISLQHRKLVVSKQNPFPALSTIM